MRGQLINSPTAPLEQGYLTYKIRWLARRRLGILAPSASLPRQISTLPYCQSSEPIIKLYISYYTILISHTILVSHSDIPSWYHIPSWCYIPTHYPGVTHHPSITFQHTILISHTILVSYSDIYHSFFELRRPSNPASLFKPLKNPVEKVGRVPASRSFELLCDVLYCDVLLYDVLLCDVLLCDEALYSQINYILIAGY